MPPYITFAKSHDQSPGVRCDMAGHQDCCGYTGRSHGKMGKCAFVLSECADRGDRFMEDSLKGKIFCADN